MRRLLFCAAIVMMPLVAMPVVAWAGTLELGTWEPSKCGPEPAMPNINDSSPETYNYSMTLVKAYVAAAKAYEDCVHEEAQRDSEIIHHALQDENQHMQARFDRLSREAKAAVDHLNAERAKQSLSQNQGRQRQPGLNQQNQQNPNPTYYSTDPSQQGQSPNASSSRQYQQQQQQQQQQQIPGQTDPSQNTNQNTNQQ